MYKYFLNIFFKKAQRLERLGTYKTSIWRNFALYLYVGTNWEHPLGIAFRKVQGGARSTWKRKENWRDIFHTYVMPKHFSKNYSLQVTASTARLLQEEGILCSFRGPTLVKGKGVIDTYFINLTDKLYVKRKIEEP